MSFWDNVKKFTQPYADDEEYDEYDEDAADGFEAEPEEEAPRARRTAAAPADDAAFSFNTPSAAPAASTGFSGQLLSSSGKQQEVVLFHPSKYDDSSKAADDLCNHKAVIVNMENVDKALARRVVDFLSGCAYAMKGKVKKIAQSTYLFCPPNMSVVGDLENMQSEVEYV